MSDLLESYTTNMFVLAFGAFGVWRGWRDLHRARASTAWPHATGEVVDSDVRIEDYHDDGEPMRRTVIAYRYDVGGTPYRGSRVFFGDDIALRFAGPGKRRLAAYPAGRHVQVAYDPADPTSAVLEPGATIAAYVAWIVPVGVALFGAFGLLAGH